MSESEGRVSLLPINRRRRWGWLLRSLTHVSILIEIGGYESSKGLLTAYHLRCLRHRQWWDRTRPQAQHHWPMQVLHLRGWAGLIRSDCQRERGHDLGRIHLHLVLINGALSQLEGHKVHLSCLSHLWEALKRNKSQLYFHRFNLWKARALTFGSSGNH